MYCNTLVSRVYADVLCILGVTYRHARVGYDFRREFLLSRPARNSYTKCVVGVLAIIFRRFLFNNRKMCNNICSRRGKYPVSLSRTFE